MPEMLEHELKRWEIKYGYLSARTHPEWRGFFNSVVNKNFTLGVFDEKMHDRKIDDQGRIYVGPSRLKALEIGEKVLIIRNEKGNFQVKRKK